jgi:hypothetical protein
MHCNLRLNRSIVKRDTLKAVFNELSSGVVFPGGEGYGITLRHVWGSRMKAISLASPLFRIPCIRC